VRLVESCINKTPKVLNNQHSVAVSMNRC